MTEASGLSVSEIPAACTLPTSERPVRVAEFNALFAAVVGGERVSERRLRLVLTGTDDLADYVRDLAARESECCSFFTFAVVAEPTGHVVLDVEVQAGYTGVLDAWAGRSGLASDAPGGSNSG